MGASPGSRETALLAPEKTVQRADAVLLTGGSAFGLAAADGVVRWLEGQGRGHVTAYGRVPIVPAAALFDLNVGDRRVRPDAEAGEAAVRSATAAPVTEGAVGAGTGATVGQFAGPEGAVRSGVGSAAIAVGGAIVAALGVSNAAGSIVDHQTGELVAGPEEALSDRVVDRAMARLGTQTTLVMVATDASISKAEARALAQSAHMGIARVTRPSHTVFDGDTAFVLSTGRGPAVASNDELYVLSIAVQTVVARALVRGVRAGMRR